MNEFNNNLKASWRDDSAFVAVRSQIIEHNSFFVYLKRVFYLKRVYRIGKKFLLLVSPMLVISIVAATVWAFIAPGIAVICTGQHLCRVFPTEYVHDFDAVALWSLISLFIGISLGMVYYQFRQLRGVPMAFFTIFSSLLTSIVSSYLAEKIVWERLKHQAHFIVKTVAPRPTMETFFPHNISQTLWGIDITHVFIRYYPMIGAPILALLTYGFCALLSSESHLGRTSSRDCINQIAH